MILYGPRGNGKTSMLRHFTINCECDGVLPAIMWMTPNRMRSLKDMTTAIASQDKSLLHEFSPVAASIDVGIAKLGTEVEIAERSSFFKDILAATCSRKPSVLIVDEAHELEPGIANDLLNASQELRSSPDTPFFLVLAGTPGLVGLLQQAHSSFWERNAVFQVGRLSAEDAADALTRPLTSAGIAFDGDIAAAVVDGSHCYPYFIQIWGQQIAFDLHDTGERSVSSNTLARIEHKVMDSINDLYSLRYEELFNAGLLDTSEHIALFFDDSGAEDITLSDITSVVRHSHGHQGGDTADTSIKNTIDKLSSTGFIWRVRPKGSKFAYYEPGIPSLMNYVLDNMHHNRELSRIPQGHKIKP